MKSFLLTVMLITLSGVSYSIDYSLPPDSLTISYQTTPVSCAGAIDGALSITGVSGGVSPYYYSWSTGAITPGLSNLSSGYYQLTVYDSGNPQIGATFPIQSPANPVISVSMALVFQWGDFQLNGPQIDTGDVLFVSFFNSGIELCAAHSEYTGDDTTHIGLLIRGDDATSPGITEGIVAGQPVNFYLWSRRYNQIIPVYPHNASGSPYQMIFTVNSYGAISSFHGTFQPQNALVQTVTTSVMGLPPLTINSTSTNATLPSGNNGSIQLFVSGGTSPYSFSWSNTAVTSGINNALPGLYQVTITDANACTAIDQNEISLDGTSPFDVQLAVTELQCYGSSLGSLSANVTGGVPPYYYKWSDGSTNSFIDTLAAGVYTVTVFDAGVSIPGNAFPWLVTPTTIHQEIKVPVNAFYKDGEQFSGPGKLGAFYHLNGQYSCAGFADITVDTLQFTIYGDNPSTPQKEGFYEGESIVWQVASGSGTFLASGYSNDAGNPPINFHNGAVSLVIFVASPLGNIDFQTTELSQPALLVATSTYSHEIIPPGNNGQILLTVSAGNPPYNYEWSDGSTVEDRTNLAGGFYHVTVGDANNCYQLKDFHLNSVQLTPITASIAVNDCQCFGSCDGSIAVTPSGGFGPYNFLWSTGSTTQNIANLCPGTYSVTVSDSLTGPMNMPFSFINTGHNHTIVFNYYIFNIPGFSTAQGDYLGVFYHRDGGLVCGGYSTIPLQGNMAISAYGDSPFTTLKDGFDPGEAFTFKYWKASTGKLINLTATFSSSLPNGGTYVYNGMSQVNQFYGSYTPPVNLPLIQSFTILQPDSISVSASIQNMTGIVGNGSISITAAGNPPFTYLWSNGGTDSSISLLQAGSYTLTVTNNSGCVKVKTYTITQSIPNIPLVLNSNISPPACHNGQGSITTTVSGGIQPYYYQWNTGAFTANLTNVTPGTYTLTLTSSLNNPLPFSWTFTPTSIYATLYYSLNVNGQLATEGDVVGAFYFNGTGLACGGFGIVNSSGYISNFKVYKDNPLTPEKDGFLDGETMIFEVFRYGSGQVYSLVSFIAGWGIDLTMPFFYGGGSNTGSFTVYITDTPSYPLKITKTYTIQNPPAFNSSYSVTGVDPGQGNDGAINLTASGGVAPYQYFWSTGTTSQNIEGLSTGNYDVTVSDSNNCPIIHHVYVGYTYPPAALSMSASQINNHCFGDHAGSIFATISGGAVPYTYLWSTGGTTASIENLQAGSYSLTVYCVMDTLAVNFLISEPDQLASNETISLIDPAIGNNGAVTIAPLGGTPPYFCEWSTGTVGFSIGNLTYGNYFFTLTDNSGCSVADSVLVGFSGPYLFFDVDTQMISCNGLADGSIALSNIIAISPIHYQWSNGNTNSSISQIAAGTYTVTISTGSGDVLAYDYEITEPAMLSLSVQYAHVHPLNNLYGWINLTPTGGTPPYTYAWSNGSSNQMIDHLSVGMYFCEVSDSHACSISANLGISYLLKPDWPYQITTQIHRLDVPSSFTMTVNGLGCDYGDFIGAFYDSAGTLACAGFMMWTGDSVRMKIYGNTLSGAVKNGFAPGEPIQFKIFDISTMTAYNAYPEYALSYPDQGNFVNNGLSGLASLTTITISGTVSTATKAAVTSGMAVLYEEQLGGSWRAMMKTLVQGGSYSFVGIEPGNYYVYVVPNPSLNLALPGYYPSASNWESASSVMASNYHNQINVVLGNVQNYAGGVGAIAGIIYAGEGSAYNPDVFGDEWFAGFKAESGVPARNIPVILYDDQLTALDFRLTNADGVFQYDQLDYGTYHVGAEMAGISTEMVEVTLSENHPQQSLIYTISNGQIISADEENIAQNVQLYPNPAQEFIWIKGLKTGDHFQLVNLLGEVLESQTAMNETVGISLKDLSSGIYVIKIESGLKVINYQVVRL